MSANRYIIRGLIDGSLSVMGVVIGAYNPDVSIIISAGIAGSLANGFSNILAAFSAEYTIKHRALKDLEHSMLISLKNTEKESEIDKVVKRSAFLDGFSTVLGGIIPIIPFLFIEGIKALFLSMIITFLLFLSLGVYTARLSRKSILISCFKLIFFAGMTVFVCFLMRYIVRF